MTHHCPACLELCGCDGHTEDIGPAPADCCCCTTCVCCGRDPEHCECSAEAAVPAPPADPGHICPKCGRPFKSPRALAIHQSKAHGVLGQSKSARYLRHAKESKQCQGR